jgi:RNA polymerase sigma-70 factor (ECF subfamily)
VSGPLENGFQLPPSTRPALEVIEGGADADRQAALRQLYQKYGGSVYGRCRYLLNDRAAAEDAMQEVFAKAVGHYGEFRADASPLTWLMKIATHHCLSLIRAHRAPWRKWFERSERSKANTLDGPRTLEMRDAVLKLLMRFDTETQAAVIHYHIDEMTLEEVAATLKRSIPTIRKRLQDFARVSQRELKP